jgi:hypothetical protein
VYYTGDYHSRSRIYYDEYGGPSSYGWGGYVGFGYASPGAYGYGYYGYPAYGLGSWYDPWWYGSSVVVYSGPWRERGDWRHSPRHDHRDYAPGSAREQVERVADRRRQSKSDGPAADYPRDRGVREERRWNSDRPSREPAHGDRESHGRRDRD